LAHFSPFINYRLSRLAELNCVLILSLEGLYITAPDLILHRSAFFPCGPERIIYKHDMVVTVFTCVLHLSCPRMDSYFPLVQGHKEHSSCRE